MKIITGSKTCLYLTLGNLAVVPTVFAGENTPSQPYPGGCWGYGFHGHSLWWILPLMFFVMIIILMLRRCGRGGSWCGRMMGGHDRDYMDWGGRSESAIEILNQRYAKGEIDKQEYEEKKAAISQSE